VALPKGTTVHLSPAVVNLSPAIWGSDAGIFDPDRWDRLQGDATSAYAFATFHNGPRVCIGKQLSIVEMKVVLMELVSRFRVEPVGEVRPVEFASPSFTLRPKERLRVRLVEL
jgi:cytochrome P450